MASSAPDLKSFTSWKLTVLNAMARDPEVSSTDFRVAYVVMGYVNQHTRTATVTDRRLECDVHRERSAIAKTRKRLARIGWWSVREGRYRVPTEYRFLTDRAQHLENIVLDAQILAQEQADSAAETQHNEKQHSAAKTPHRERRHSAVKAPHWSSAAETPHTVPQCGVSDHHSAVFLPPIHLLTPRRGLPEQGSSQTHTHEHAHESDDPRAGWDAEDWRAAFDERAGALESDGSHTREEAEQLARAELVALGMPDESV